MDDKTIRLKGSTNRGFHNIRAQMTAPSFSFKGRDGMEILRLDPDGGIFVHGRLAENDKQIVDGLRNFLNSHGY